MLAHKQKTSTNPFLQQDLISCAQLNRDNINLLLTLAQQLQQTGPRPYLQNKVIARCFFEPSTRTRLSFESAIYRLDGKIIGFSDSNTTSATKGESLSDTIRVISTYADAIIMRHPLDGSAKLAAEISDKPIINAGDGINQHPTQTLTDLMSIHQSQGKLDDLAIACVGDLCNGRTIHSLIQVLCHYHVRLYFISPAELNLPDKYSKLLKQAGIRFSFHTAIDEVIDKIDILYMTRLQKERQTQHRDYENCRITLKQLDNAKTNLKILHPLPRVDEIETSIDKTAFAYYFQQAANGVFVRQALLALILGIEENPIDC